VAVKSWRCDPPANLAVLDELAQRGLPVVPPVRTTDGALAASTYAVYPIVRGRPAPEDPDLLRKTLRQVHSITDMDVPGSTMDESCVEFLREHLVRDLAARVSAEVDRPGIEQWGFRRLDRLDDVLDQIT
jgi:hypothetical protein